MRHLQSSLRDVQQHGCRREPTPPEVRAAREREKELAELDRDIRTVFAYNLNLKAEEKDLFQFFSTAGKVLDVRIISDRNTRRSKGFAYIEYARRVRVPSASVSLVSLQLPASYLQQRGCSTYALILICDKHCCLIALQTLACVNKSCPYVACKQVFIYLLLDCSRV